VSLATGVEGPTNEAKELTAALYDLTVRGEAPDSARALRKASAASERVSLLTSCGGLSFIGSPTTSQHLSCPV
jgi:hypothetical protein